MRRVWVARLGLSVGQRLANRRDAGLSRRGHGRQAAEMSERRQIRGLFEADPAADLDRFVRCVVMKAVAKQDLQEPLIFGDIQIYRNERDR